MDKGSAVCAVYSEGALIGLPHSLQTPVIKKMQDVTKFKILIALSKLVGYIITFFFFLVQNIEQGHQLEYVSCFLTVENLPLVSLV